MRVKQYTITGGGAADTANFAALQAPTVNVALTLAGGAAAISPARELTLTSGADLSAINFRVIGTDRWGNPVDVTVPGPATATVTYKYIFSKITSITPDNTSASTVSAGYPQRVTTPWVGLNTWSGRDALTKGVIGMETLSGAPTAAAELTLERFTVIPADGARPLGSAATLNNTTAAEVQGTAIRAVLTSAAGSAKFTFARPRF